jgi:arylsulfatase A-like enzyme
VDPAKVKLPPYYPDTDSVRLDVARFYTNVSEMDDWVGERIRELEASGELQNTIIMFWSDHGDGLPHVKREVTDRGIRVPFIVRLPMDVSGRVDDRLVSSIDWAPTVLSLAGIVPPENMQGLALLGPYAAKQPREYVFAARDRIDSHYDRVRSVHDGRYQYLYNFHPELPYYMDLAYRRQQPSMRDILRLRDAGTLNAVQMRWFGKKGGHEELYDVKADPYQLHDLSADPAHAAVLERMRKAFRQWQSDVPDLGAIPEKELISQWWQGKGQPPVTEVPTVTYTRKYAKVRCATPGASIVYKVIGKQGVEPVRWEVYTDRIPLREGERVMAMAQRTGYLPSPR